MYANYGTAAKSDSGGGWAAAGIAAGSAAVSMFNKRSDKSIAKSQARIAEAQARIPMAAADSSFPWIYVIGGLVGVTVIGGLIYWKMR